MSDEITRKRVTLHPLKDDGSIDENINLYPKTFVDGIVDREGEEVEVALASDIPTNYVTTDTDQTIEGHKTISEDVSMYANLEFLGNGNSLIFESPSASEPVITLNKPEGHYFSRKDYLNKTRFEATGGYYGTAYTSYLELGLTKESSDSELANVELFNTPAIKFKTADSDAVYTLELPKESGTLITSNSAGTKLYKHTITLLNSSTPVTLEIINTISNKLENIQDIPTHYEVLSGRWGNNEIMYLYKNSNISLMVAYYSYVPGPGNQWGTLTFTYENVSDFLDTVTLL